MFFGPFSDFRAAPPGPAAGVVPGSSGSLGAPGRPRPGPAPRRRGRTEEGSGPQEEDGGAGRGRGGREPRARRSPERSARLPTPRPAPAYAGESYGRVLGVDGVEDALVADLRLGDKADLAADVRGAPAHGAAAAAAAPRPLTPEKVNPRRCGRSALAHARRAYSSRLRPNMAAAPAPLPSPSLPPSSRGAAAAAAAAAAARSMLDGEAEVSRDSPGGRWHRAPSLPRKSWQCRLAWSVAVVPEA